MAEDINDERGEAVSVTGCGQRRQAAGLHQSQLGSGWLGLTHGPIRSRERSGVSNFIDRLHLSMFELNPLKF